MQNPIVKVVVSAVGAQRFDGAGDVGRDAVPRRRLDMRHVVEALAASAHARRPPEPVDRQGVDARSANRRASSS